MNSYSQAGEDSWILKNLKPPVGTFCEVGAYDGVKSSNTLLFEELGWTGLLIEAVPELAGRCRKNRKSPTICIAAGPWEMIEFAINDSDLGLSGEGRPGARTLVPMCPLFRILHAANLTTVDLVSIDTEGTELQVWSSIGSIRPRIVIMEYQTCDEPPQDELIVHQMKHDGYKEVHRTRHNIIFTR